MALLIPAAQQLIREVQHLRPKGTASGFGDADGIGFIRSVTFDAATTKWLLPILEAVNDERIASVETTSNKTVVTFVSDTRADFATPFDLASAHEVLSE